MRLKFWDRRTSLQRDIERNRDLNIWGRQPMLLSVACPTQFSIGDLVMLPTYVSGIWVVTRANERTVGVFPNYKTGLPHVLP
jgi:hypothetical protein